MLGRLFKPRLRSGTVIEDGKVAHCIDESMVRWPGTYRVVTNKYGHEVIDPDTQVVYDDEAQVWRVK